MRGGGGGGDNLVKCTSMDPLPTDCGDVGKGFFELWICSLNVGPKPDDHRPNFGMNDSCNYSYTDQGHPVARLIPL